MGRWIVALGLCGMYTGCAADKGSDDTSASTSTASTSNTGGTTSTGGTTGTPGLECEDLASEEQCREMVSQNDLPCEWIAFRAVQRDGDVCTDLPSVSLCVELSGWTTEAGCGSDPDCPALVGEALYRQLPGGAMLITTQCGGSSPVSFSACETVLPDASPPECACACPTFPDYGETSTG